MFSFKCQLIFLKNSYGFELLSYKLYIADVKIEESTFYQNMLEANRLSEQLTSLFNRSTFGYIMTSDIQAANSVD